MLGSWIGENGCVRRMYLWYLRFSYSPLCFGLYSLSSGRALLLISFSTVLPGQTWLRCLSLENFGEKLRKRIIECT